MANAPKPSKALSRMTPYAPPLEGRADKLRLDFNENLAGCSPKVLEALQTGETPESVATYPEYLALRKKLGGKLGVAASQLTIGAGTDELISALLHAFVNPEDEVLIADPSFSMFRFYAELVGGAVKLVPRRRPDFEFPTEEFIEAIGPGTRAVCIASPDNPTGGIVELDDLERILEAADGCAVLVDEAYFEFHGETAMVLVERWPNLFVSRTFSKAYGMAGLRIGALASQPGNIEIVRKGQSPYGANAIAVRCALAALDDEEYVREYVEDILEARELICAAFDEFGIRYWPSRANFVLFEIGDKVREACAKLSEQGVLIRDQSARIPGAARVTVGPLLETVKFMTAILRTLKR